MNASARPKTMGAMGILAMLGTSCIHFWAAQDVPAVRKAYAPDTAASVLPAAHLYREATSLNLWYERTESNSHRAPVMEATAALNVPDGTRYQMEIWPRVLVVGQTNIEIRIRLTRRGLDYWFHDGAHRFALRAQDAAADVPLIDVSGHGVQLVGTVPEVTEQMVGWQALELSLNGVPAESVPFAVNVVRCVRIALTFDDGPSVERFRYLGMNAAGRGRTSTEKILDVLGEEGIAGAFFVLTTADSFFWKTHRKAETPAGFALLRRMIREGHVVAAHWGGRYVHQTVCHTGRLALPAYDHDGDGVVDRLTEKGSALETDLLECVGRIRQAMTAEGMAEAAPEFVRPPLWKYRDGELDARPTYRALGLSMVSTDGKLYDGGYPWAGFTLDTWLLDGASDAIAAGRGDIILTMHDSNPHTARDIEAVIAQIRKFMDGRGLAEGTQWRFVGTADELNEVLRGRLHGGRDVDAR